MSEITTNEEQIPAQNLVEQLIKEIDFSDCVIWGHGTLSEEIANKILSEGIIVNPGYTLLEIATPITTSTNSPEQNAAEIANRTKSWQHKEAKYVILLSIPDGRRPNFVVEQVEVEGNARTHLPSRFIRGYIDANEDKFIGNPLFVKESEPTSGLHPQEFGPIKRTNPDVGIPTQITTSSDADTPDVW